MSTDDPDRKLPPPANLSRLGRALAWGRLIRVLLVMVWETTKLAFLVRFKPEDQQAMFRAEYQRQACVKFCKVIRVSVTRVGEAPTGGNIVVVPNHFSLMDGWVIAAALPIAFAVKAEMSSWPIMGWVCRTVGMVFVRRDRRLATTMFVDDLRRVMNSGVRPLVFPEGTTGDGLSIRPFKTGAFAGAMAVEDSAVLPVYWTATHINGKETTAAARSALGWHHGEPMMNSAMRWLRAKSIVAEVRVGTPIPTAGRNRKELAAEARAAMVALAGDMVDQGTGASSPSAPSMTQEVKS